MNVRSQNGVNNLLIARLQRMSARRYAGERPIGPSAISEK
jgi:hypothetical protein